MTGFGSQLSVASAVPKGVGESPNVGGVSAISNAVIDAFAHQGVTHMQMPHSAYNVWKTISGLGLNK